VEITSRGSAMGAPLWFNATLALLGKRFDYPEILRRPTSEILERFRAGGPSLILLWWAFMLSGLLLIAGAVLLGQVLGFGDIVPVATTIGVLAGLVQMLGLLRWVYVVPGLARTYANPTFELEQREVHAAVFRALHQYLGVGLGEHLGYLFTGIRSVLIGGCDPGNGAAHLAGVARGRHRCRAGALARPSSWAQTKSGVGVSQEPRSRSSTSRGPSGCSRWVSR